MVKKRFSLFPAVAGALGAGLVLARQITWGVGLGPDGINYAAIARNLLAGEGFTDFDGGVSTLWPPLWPLLLAAAGLGILDPIRVAGPLNAALFALTVFVLGRYLERRLESRFVARWATLAFALSAPLAEVSRQAMSEPAFLLFTTLALVAADRFFEHGVDGGAGGNRGRSLLLRAAGWSALAWLTRYLGVALVASVGLLLLLRRRGTAPARTRCADAGLYTAVAAAPMALWLFRNLRATGSPTGHTRAVEYSGTGLLADFGSGLAEFAAFDHGAWFLPAAALSLAGAWFLHRRGPGSRAAPLPETDLSRPPGPIPVFGVFAAGYLAALAFALVAGQTWHGVAARFLAPLSVPLLVLAAAAFDRLSAALALRKPGPAPADRETVGGIGQGTGRAPFARAFRSGLAWAPGLVLTGGLAFHLLGQVLPNARAIARANSGAEAPGAGYRGGPWAESETLRALREGPLPARLYSNLPLLAYLETEGRTEVRYLPADLSPVVKRRGGAPTTPGERLARGLSGIGDGARIVWHREFGSAEYRHGSPPAFRVQPSLRLVGEFPDGGIWEVARGGEPAGGGEGARGGEPGSNPYRAAYAAIAAGEFGEPVARTAFDFYRRDRTLALLREPCSPEDLAAGFFLHLHPPVPPSIPPSIPDSLPEARRQVGFENRDFQFFEHGVILDRPSEGASGEGLEPPKCLALVPLPRRDFDRILVGQVGPGPSDGPAGGPSSGPSSGLSGGPPAPRWEAIVRGDRDRYRAAYDAIVSGESGEPAARAGFDLYLGPDPDPDREGTALIYFEPSCSRADRELKFFLHLHPAEPEALPPERRAYGFENRDFDFREYGLTVPAGVGAAEHCLAIVPLPPGDFPRIATGQWRAGEAPVWTAVLGAGARVSTPGGWPALYESLVAGERGEPVARSFFDLYLDGTGLAYLREPCAEADTAARFFFHLYPGDREDLPEDRRQYGFENRDFDFADRGVILPPDHDPRLGPESAGAKCLAVAPLPAYDLLRLRTGQWTRAEGGLWAVEWAPGGPRLE